MDAPGAHAGASGTSSASQANGMASAAPGVSQLAKPAGRRMKPTFLLRPKEQKPTASSKQTQLSAAMQVKPPVARSPAAGSAPRQEQKQTQLTLQQALGAGAQKKPAAAKAPDLKSARSEGPPTDEQQPVYRPRWCAGVSLTQ